MLFGRDMQRGTCPSLPFVKASMAFLTDMGRRAQ